jgi:hypothetical protein
MNQTDFNPYVFGKNPLSFNEAQRHVLRITQELNQGKEVLSRDAAFLLGLSVHSFCNNIVNRGLITRRKVFNRVNLFNRDDVLCCFFIYKAKQHREHVYIGKQLYHKNARLLLELAFKALSTNKQNRD